jgi:hypothetical protein
MAVEESQELSCGRREHSSSVMFAGSGVGLVEATNRQLRGTRSFNALELTPEEEN